MEDDLVKIQSLRDAVLKDPMYCVPAFNKLSAMALKKHQPHLLLILSIYHTQLDPKKIPQSIVSRSKEHVLSIMGSTCALGAMGAVAMAHRESPVWDDIVRIWTELWPTHIWKWMDFLSHCIEAKENADWRIIVIRAINDLLYCFGTDPGPLREVSKSKAVKLLARFWWLEAKEPDFSPWIPASDRQSGAVTAIFDVYIRAALESGGFDWKESIISPMRETVADVASAALLRLRNSISRTPVDYICIGGTLDLIILLSRHTPIFYALLAQNSPRLVTKALAALPTSLPPSPNLSITSHIVVTCINSCVYHLVMSLGATNGIDWAIQIVEAQVLTALLRLHPWMDQLWAKFTTWNAVLTILIRELPVYLIYISVLKPVEKASMRIMELNLEADVPKSGPFWEAWVRFKGVLEDRLKVNADTKVTFSNQRRPCSNNECAKLDLRNDFMRCGACSERFYCSKSCQKYDWKEGGHREVCKKLVQWRQEGKIFPLSRRDLRSANKVISEELTRRSKEVCKAAIDPQYVLPVVEFLYSSVPPGVTISSAADSPPDNYDTDQGVRQQWDGIISEAKKRYSVISPIVIIRVYLPVGEAHELIVRTISIDLLGNNKGLGNEWAIGAEKNTESGNEEDEDVERLRMLLQTMGFLKPSTDTQL